MAERSIARTPVLSITYQAFGPPDGPVTMLLHGFPYSADSYSEVAPLLAADGFRVIVPDLRGYGGTRFLAPSTPRSGEQAAIGHDVVDLLDALKIEKALLAGYDWGGRGAAIVAALWPDRVRGLVSCGGYPIQDIAASAAPVAPEQEYRFWYQHYFQTERGRRGLQENRHALTRLLWKLWSPSWAFDEATLKRSTACFETPDFVDVVLHSYRHRLGNAPGDPVYAATESALARLPTIGVPTLVLHGADDGVGPVQSSVGHRQFFTGPYERRVLEGVGHNPPQEAPKAFADAVMSLAAP